jgi:tetratricopeptide (TPR) repeat protein
MAPIKQYIPRQVYAHAVEESLELEKKGDELDKLGRPELAARKYQKSVHLEEEVLGEHHPVVEEFHTKIINSEEWKPSLHRVAADALSSSLAHEKEGDKLVKLGQKEKARHEYDVALKIEEKVVGQNHPMVNSLKEKIIINTSLE